MPRTPRRRSNSGKQESPTESVQRESGRQPGRQSGRESSRDPHESVPELTPEEIAEQRAYLQPGIVDVVSHAVGEGPVADVNTNDSDTNDSDTNTPVLPRDDLSVRERHRQAMALKTAGLSYSAIARQLGMSPEGARQAVLSGLSEALTVDATVLKATHYARLEQIVMLNWPDVQRKDAQATAMVLGAMDRIERLYDLQSVKAGDAEDADDDAVLVITGNKDSYIATLREARKRQGIKSREIEAPDTSGDK